MLLAFLAAGHVPDEAKHGAVVSQGIGYLLGQISDDGLFVSKHSGQYMYEHGIATIALELPGARPPHAGAPIWDSLKRCGKPEHPVNH